MDAVLGHLVVPDGEDLEQAPQHRDLRRGGREGGGQVQPTHQHHEAGRHGHAALTQAAQDNGPAVVGPPLPDARPDPAVQLLRDGTDS